MLIVAVVGFSFIFTTFAVISSTRVINVVLVYKPSVDRGFLWGGD